VTNVTNIPQRKLYWRQSSLLHAVTIFHVLHTSSGMSYISELKPAVSCHGLQNVRRSGSSPPFKPDENDVTRGRLELWPNRGPVVTSVSDSAVSIIDCAQNYWVSGLSPSSRILNTGKRFAKCCEMLRIPHCLDNRFTDGGKVGSPMHRPPSALQKHYFYVSDTHFC
jgi:hypothetical protein